MAKIPLTNGFQRCPEGSYIFRIYEVNYDENFGVMEVKLVNAQGVTHTERYSLKDANDNVNEGAMNAFSYFAKNAMNDFGVEELDSAELVNRYVRATIVHTRTPSKRDPSKMSTFANAKDFSPADGFDTTPTEKAMNIGTTANTNSGNGVDLVSLLG